jgi:polar amino acid transport system substrate-binding protein
MPAGEIGRDALLGERGCRCGRGVRARVRQLAPARQKLILHVVLLLLAIVAALIVPLPASLASEGGIKQSKLLQAIKQRGEIAIGVKTDFAPFGFLDASGAPIGLEIDLAQRVADDLGLRLRLVPVTTETRFQRLEQGSVDLIIATAGDTQERRTLATAIEPNYYGSGVNILLRPESGAKSWQELRGQRICALQGAYFNRGMTQRYILDLVRFRSVRDALLALQDGRCVGFLYTEVAVAHYLGRPEFSRYSALDGSALIAPWAVSIARSERGTDFAVLLSEIIARWHREGILIELEKRWNVRPAKFVQDAYELWNRKDANGNYVCARQEDGQLPVTCRNKAFVTSDDVEGGQKFGLWLKEQLNINLSIIHDPFDRQRYLAGLFYTLLLSFGSIVSALVLGYFGAKLVMSGGFLTRIIATPLLNIGRMTPPILQMYLLFFGASSWLNAQFGVSLSPLAVAVLALGLYHGSIIVFAFLDGAEVLRSRNKSYRLTLETLPDLLYVSAVGVRSALSNLAKATTIAAAISVPELLSATIAIISDQGNPDVMMPLLLVAFYIYAGAFIAVWMKIEKRIVGRRSV